MPPRQEESVPPGMGLYGPDDYVRHRWRIGRKVGRTIYAQLGAEPSDEDLLIGVMDSPALAIDAIKAHNVEWGYA